MLPIPLRFTLQEKHSGSWLRVIKYMTKSFKRIYLKITLIKGPGLYIVVKFK